MAFIIANWLFEPESKTLKYTEDGYTTVITDQQVALLSVLCESGGNLIPQTEIEEKAWIREVSDNTFKTAISNLRKCFDHKNSKGINVVINVRGRGYKLCDVSVYDSGSILNETHSPTISIPLKARLTFNYQVKILLTTFTLLLLGIFGVKVQDVISNPISDNTVPDDLVILTYEKGAELNATYHRSGKLIAYMSMKHNINNHRVKVRDLNTNKIVGFPDFNISSSPQWYGDDLYFQVYQDEQCSIVKASYSGAMTFTSVETITSCGTVESVSPLQVDSFGEWLYFSFKSSGSEPYEIKRISLRTGNIDKLTTDSNENFGAYSIALSPEGNYLAYLNMGANLEVSVRVLDLNTLTIDEIYSGVGYSLNILWDNQDELFFPIGKKLYGIDVNTQKKRVVRVFDEPIYSISKSTDNNYVLSYGYLYESRIQRIVNNVAESIYESSNQIGQIIVREESMYFVGQMNGKNQIWKMMEDELAVLTDFSEYERIRSISLSEDGTRIVFLLGNRIALLNLETNETVTLDTESDMIKDIVWSCDSEDILFTTKVNGVWLLNKLMYLDGSPRYENVMKDIYRVQTDCSSGLIALSGNSHKITVTDFKNINYEIETEKYVPDFNWKLNDQDIYFTEKGRLYKFNKDEGERKILYKGESKMNSFDILNDEVYFTDRTIGDNKLVIFKGINISY